MSGFSSRHVAQQDVGFSPGWEMPLIVTFEVLVVKIPSPSARGRPLCLASGLLKSCNPLDLLYKLAGIFYFSPLKITILQYLFPWDNHFTDRLPVWYVLGEKLFGAGGEVRNHNATKMDICLEELLRGRSNQRTGRKLQKCRGNNGSVLNLLTAVISTRGREKIFPTFGIPHGC